MAKILIIDDSFEDLSEMKAILEEEKHKVYTATNGAQALDLLMHDSVQLVLIDVQMPTLSGYDLLRLLRERLNHKVPMIYVTIVPKNNVILDDIDGFVQKPLSPDKLLKEINRVLKK